jgi:hypothetical protein
MWNSWSRRDGLAIAVRTAGAAMSDVRRWAADVSSRRRAPDLEAQPPPAFGVLQQNRRANTLIAPHRTRAEGLEVVT